jgi:hypothetical protein
VANSILVEIPCRSTILLLKCQVAGLSSRLKEVRRIAARYEILAANYAAMLTIAAIFLLSQGFAYTP